ncbi:hypothetical protein DP64_07590 [Stutzerimonas degradans]|nr:hypothetical protein DP64_07590 [Stutzerimonas degradans]
MMTLALGLADGAGLEMQADSTLIAIIRSEQLVRDEAVDRSLCRVSYGACYTTHTSVTEHVATYRLAGTLIRKAGFHAWPERRKPTT